MTENVIPIAPNDRITEVLMELRRISALESELKKSREAYTAEIVPLLELEGSRLITDPMDQKLKSAHVIRAERTVVDAAELYEALLEQEGGDVEQADMIYAMVLKPPSVDTAIDGLFVQACSDTPEAPAYIRPETIVKVAKYKRSAPYVAFTRPGG